MGFEKRIMELGAVRREQGDLGGVIVFPQCEPTPCAMGMDTSGLARADNSAGFQFNQLRRVVVRAGMLTGLARQPQAGDVVELRGNLEAESVWLTISPTNGIEQFNAILTAFNLYNPNA